MSEQRWSGETVVCIGSGPSLTKEDCELVRGYRRIAVNSSWRMVPDCDVIYASDYAWWRRYSGEISSTAERWTCNKKTADEYQCQLFKLGGGYNSGLAAIHLAMWFGAKRILLLGYDCKPTNGKLHWHGAHSRLNNPNEISFRIWRRQFRMTPKHIRDRIVNCSRETVLTYTRARLEDAICSAPQESGDASQCVNS